jgi:hypothetical protein
LISNEYLSGNTDFEATIFFRIRRERVIIAPLQNAGVLTTDLLAIKDVDKGIAGRATGRDDERRWCREGKLPKLGWWE